MKYPILNLLSLKEICKKMVTLLILDLLEWILEKDNALISKANYRRLICLTEINVHDFICQPQGYVLIL